VQRIKINVEEQGREREGEREREERRKKPTKKSANEFTLHDLKK